MKTFKNLKRVICLILLTSPLVVKAQSSDTVSTSAKIDSIYTLQKKMYVESKNEPLTNKNYGLELNIFRLLLIDKYTTVSGSFSLFNVNRHSEISFPFYFQKAQNSDDLSEFTLDGHYRYFLGNTQNGFYLSGFARFAFLHGRLGNNDLLSWNEEKRGFGNEGKFGVGVGLGFRKFSYSGLYWGASLSFGRYLIGESNKFSGSFISTDDDNEFIIDIELLKFGWAF